MKKYERFAKQFKNERERHNLSQESVADKLSVSSKTVKRWESGENLPQPEIRGRICELFKKNAEEMGFREEHVPDSQHHMRMAQECGESPSVKNFYGRDEELAKLRQWVVNDNCRVVAVLGMGGVGKTSLSAKLVEQIQETFEYICWCSLHNLPPLEHILRNCIELVSGQHIVDVPKERDEQIRLLIQYLRHHRCLLVLDNFESILQAGRHVSQYQTGYDDYGRLIRYIGETGHRSCLLLTSREKPIEITRLEGKSAPVRSLFLSGVGQDEGQKMLEDKDLFGSNESWATLVRLYSGNPLALKLIAESIREVFNGDITEFLAEKEIVFGYIQDFLEEQIRRLSELEQEVMYWLAIEREAISLSELWENIIHRVPKSTLLEAVNSLRRRAMIEFSGGNHFTLQPVIMEYMTRSFVEQIAEEIDTNTIRLFGSHALIKAQTKDYIKESQIRLILGPVAEKLLTAFGKEESEKKLKNVLASLHTIRTHTSSYAAGNVLNLLIQLRADLRGTNFSHLTVRQAYLRGIGLPEVNFSHSNLATSVFTDNFSSVLCLAISPKGDLLAAGTTTGEVWVWQVDTATPLFLCIGHEDDVRSVAFSHDGEFLASGSEDQTIRIWDTNTGHLLKILHGHDSLVRAVSFSPHGNTMVSGSEDQTIRLWDVNTGACCNILRGHTHRIRSVSFSPDGRTIVSGSDDKTVRLWDASTGECRDILQGHGKPVRIVAFSPDGRTVASGSEDQTVQLWDASTGQSLRVLQGHTSRVRSISFMVGIIATSGEDQTIRLWDANTGNCLRVLQGHTNRIWAVAFVPDSNVLVSASEDETTRFWEVRTGLCLRILQGYTSLIKSVAFNPNGRTLASGSEDQAIRLWKVDTGQCLKTLHGHANRVRFVTFSPDGGIIASGSEDETVRLWDADTGHCLKILQGHTHLVRSVAFSPNGNLLVSGSHDKTVRLWDVATGQCLQILREHASLIWCVAFSPDSKVLASSGDDKKILLWDVATGQPLGTLSGHNHRVWSVSFSPDGSLIASGSDDQTVRLWEVSTGKPINTLQGHTGGVRCVAFSPDGSLVASGSNDQTILLWDVAVGQCAKSLRGHTSRVWSVAFSPDGSIISSGSDDGTIKLWSVYEGACLKTLRSERLYERMNIVDAKGLTEGQRATLSTLGATV